MNRKQRSESNKSSFSKKSRTHVSSMKSSTLLIFTMFSIYGYAANTLNKADPEGSGHINEQCKKSKQNCEDMKTGIKYTVNKINC